MPCMMFRTLLVVAELQTCAKCSMVKAYTLFGAQFTCFFGHYYLECVNCSAGIIRSIDTISNINLKDGMCHMKLTGL